MRSERSEEPRRTNAVLGESRGSENDGFQSGERQMAKDSLVESFVESIESLREKARRKIEDPERISTAATINSS